MWSGLKPVSHGHYLGEKAYAVAGAPHCGEISAQL
jgi:hypothetical protein